jgi:hypothetical protein
MRGKCKKEGWYFAWFIGWNGDFIWYFISFRQVYRRV